MDFGQTTTTTEARGLISMVWYYSDMWPKRSCLLAHLIKADSVPKDRKVLWNDALERSFKEIKCMVSSEMLLSCPE